MVYLLTNEAMPRLIKIGMTTTTVEQRSRGRSGRVYSAASSYSSALVIAIAKTTRAVDLAHDFAGIRGNVPGVRHESQVHAFS